MRDLTDFEWDGLYIFPPYTGHQEIENTLGYSWPPAEDSGIDMDDTFCLLVFTHNKEVVAYVEYPIERGDFADVGGTTKLSPDDAVFLVRMENGRPIMSFAE
ncbi:MAG: hypothetical protein ACP5HU_04120 [Phycisphaerae bacterium]